MDWWQDFFDENYLKLWTPMLTPERTEPVVAGVLRMLDLPSGAELLDLACGQGRIAVPLAKAGLRVTGLDWSETLLGHARAAAQAAGVDMELVRRDMRDIPWTERFDAAINIFTAFGYFGDEEDQKVLDGVARALKPGGKFIIDITHRDRVTAVFQPHDWYEVEGTPVWEERSFDLVSGWNEETIHWLDGGTIREKTFRTRPYSATELTKMLRRAGLEPVSVFGDWQGGAFKKETRLIVLSEKK